MGDRKLLLVSTVLDLGGAALERYLIRLFEPRVDFKLHRFAPLVDPSKIKEGRTAKHVLRRAAGAPELWHALHAARHEGRKILFQLISPAVFGAPAAPVGTTHIVTDFSRLLFKTRRSASLKGKALAALHRRVIGRQRLILCTTSTVREQIHADYGVPLDKLVKVPQPNTVDAFDASPLRHDNEVRLLFVGGDFSGKGGHVVLDWFRSCNNPRVTLTMVTKNQPPGVERVKWVLDLTPDDPRLREVYREHDLFVLPTRRDAGPMAMYEAAAAGLGIVISSAAIGAPDVVQDGVNGFICATDEACRCRLSELAEQPDLVESMKRASREFAERQLAPDAVFGAYAERLFSP